MMTAIELANAILGSGGFDTSGETSMVAIKIAATLLHEAEVNELAQTVRGLSLGDRSCILSFFQQDT